MSVNYIEKYGLPTVAQLLTSVDKNKKLATYRANCYDNAKALNVMAENYFFSDNTNKFFNARYGYFFETGVFTHSVRNRFDGTPREYRVSWVNPNGVVIDLFSCATLKTAEKCARFYNKEFQRAGVLETYYRQNW